MLKTQKELNSNLLIAIYQNLQTAKQSINNVIEKVNDSRLKKELKSQFKEYDAMSEECEDLAEIHDIELVNNNFFVKARMWLSVNFATLMDKSNRKIASINIVGSTMGIIDLMSVLSDCKKCKKDLLTFGKKVLEYEESNIEKLKPYILLENNKTNLSSSLSDETFEEEKKKNNKKVKENKLSNKKQKLKGRNILKNKVNENNGSQTDGNQNENKNNDENKNVTLPTENIDR